MADIHPLFDKAGLFSEDHSWLTPGVSKPEISVHSPERCLHPTAQKPPHLRSSLQGVSLGESPWVGK